MYIKLTIAEKLKDLRVNDRHLTLEQLAEQTHLSKSALGKYETDECKDISPFAIATLAQFYDVSTDYLLGLTENKKSPSAECTSLHLSDEMIALLQSGKINNRLLCEIATHENFRRLMTDIEIVVDRIADMRIQNMNTIMEAMRQEVIACYAPDENDLHLRTLEVAQVQEIDYFDYVVHEDLDAIIHDVRREHLADTTTADDAPALTEIREKLSEAMNYDSKEEAIIQTFCDRMQIPFEKISKDEFEIFLRIIGKSRLLKEPMSKRGKKRNYSAGHSGE